MVVLVQAFDVLAVSGGGAVIMPLNTLFDGIYSQPTAPEFWWVYVLLLSTLLPSMLNLMIGGACLMRGIPAIPSLLLPFVSDDGKGVLFWDRHWIAAVLTGQIAVGACLGIMAQVMIVVLVIGYVMPWFGADLSGMAREIADLNLPMKLGF
jgi:hypothetical protein